MNRILRKIYARKNNFLKVNCINCSDQIDLIESFVDWIFLKYIMIAPGWYVRWTLRRAGYTDESIEESARKIKALIDSKLLELNKKSDAETKKELLK